MRISAILISASVALMLGGCSSTPAPTAPIENAKPATATPPSGPTMNPAEGMKTPATVEVTPPAPAMVNSSSELTDPKSALSRRSVYFDFDKYEVKDEFRSLLQAHAGYLSRNRTARMLIQGNADERGSREYNLALGQRRADAVKRTMGLLGAAESQMESVSLGKEKPRCLQHTEECFAENRRADMLYASGNVKEF
jgi:peptidoglycan-associated lipoprotein